MSSQDPLLAARLQREAQFHDAKYGGAELYPRHYAARPTQYVYAQLRACLGDLHGKRVLEYGCGEGWITRDLARMGGQVCAFDISPQAAQNTRGVLAAEGLLDRCRVEVMPAESLVYEPQSFDVAVGFAIIHHLDLVKALAELHRVLKPGGRIALFDILHASRYTEVLQEAGLTVQEIGRDRLWLMPCRSLLARKPRDSRAETDGKRRT